mgnify:CR=1 FL=1
MGMKLSYWAEWVGEVLVGYQLEAVVEMELV